jgi:hypothetical protein
MVRISGNSKRRNSLARNRKTGIAERRELVNHGQGAVQNPLLNNDI